MAEDYERSMLMKGKKILSAFLAALMVVSLAACGSTGASSSADVSGGASGDSSSTGVSSVKSANDGTSTVTVGYVGTHDSSYPSSSTSNDLITNMLVYDKLFEVDDYTGDYTSRVLNSWEWQDDVTLVLNLKDGIYFSDGNQMTGQDVLFSLQNYMRNGGVGTDKGAYYQYIDFDKSYVADDNMTVYVVWTQEYGPALRTLDCPIMEKDFTEAHDETDEIWWTGPVGSGPYEVTDCKIDSYVTFSLRDDYWDSADYSYDPTEITIKYYNDENAMYVDYQTGILDVIYNISDTVCQQIEDAGDQGAVDYVSNNDVTMLALNSSEGACTDIAVREAIAYALDMDSIMDVAYGNLATTADSHVGKNFDCYSSHDNYSYDPDKAKQVLEDAGYSDGDITLKFLTTSDTIQTRIAEAVQGYLAEVGINVEINSYDLGTFLSILMEGGNDMCLQTINGGNPTCEPEVSLGFICSTGFVTPQTITYQDVIDAATTGQSSVDEDERNAAYKEADDLMYEYYLMLPICETQSAYAYNNSRITSFDQSSVGRSCLGSMKLE